MTDAASPEELWGVEALEAERRRRVEYLSMHAGERQQWIDANPYYYGKVAGLLSHLIEPGRSALHLRCETGDLLAAVKPSEGKGLEISQPMTDIAAARHPDLSFVCGDPETYREDRTYDYVLSSNITDTVNVQAYLETAAAHCHHRSRLVIYTYNYLWQPILAWASRRGLRLPLLEPNWLSTGDLDCFLNLAGFDRVRTFRTILLPKRIPVVSWLANRVLARVPGVSRLCMVSVTVARPRRAPLPKDVKVSVIVPCKNEEGNIAEAVRRTPEMGAGTELIFCDDKSTDGTAEAVRKAIRENPDKNIRLVEGPGVCKAQNVWAGFRAATGDALMILDADLTVMPEELPLFFKTLADGTADFVNGSRMIYPMRDQAMKYANFVGNKTFSVMFSLLFGHYIKDTLCGTKALWAEDFKRIEPYIGTWGAKDLWGDYDLLFGAARLNLAVQDLPVHYQERIYGVTKMRRVFWNGLRMMRLWLAAWRTLRQGYY